MDFKKIWEGIKNFFVVFGIICAIAACFLFFNNKKAQEYIKILEGRLQARERELEESQRIERERAEAQAQREKELNDKIKELQDKYDTAIKNIDAATRAALAEAYNIYKDDPVKQAAELRRILGIRDE
jgi:predicted Holliday junction resolvase-like endonuclease